MAISKGCQKCVVPKTHGPSGREKGPKKNRCPCARQVNQESGERKLALNVWGRSSNDTKPLKRTADGVKKQEKNKDVSGGFRSVGLRKLGVGGQIWGRKKTRNKKKKTEPSLGGKNKKRV